MNISRPLNTCIKTAANIITIASLLTIAFCAVICSLTLFGCAAAKPACAIIDAAHAACAVITYQDEFGNTRVVRVSSEELVAFGKQMEAAHAADAGAP